MTAPEAAAGLLQSVTTEVDAFAEWFAGTFAPLVLPEDRDAFDAWSQELQTIERLANEPSRVRVALIGTTGAGKSTFLNAVLRHEVLPVGVMHPCTAFVTTVSYEAGPGYRLTVRYATREEWMHDVEAFAAMLEPGETDDGAVPVESTRIKEVARKRLQGVFGDGIAENSTAAQIRSAELPASAREVLDGPSLLELRFADSKEMLSHLRGLVREGSPLWPLVREVAIRGPFDPLKDGIELVDLPGLNDPNDARVEVTREYLRSSPFVWLVFSMVRGITADIQQILYEERVLRTLVLNGTYAGLALVGTRADDIDLDSAEQLGLSEDCELPELIAAYREQTVREAREQLEEIVRSLPGTADTIETQQRMIDLARNVRVHATSAKAYNRLAGVGRLRSDYGLDDEDATGIPAVREHLAEIGREAGSEFNARMARVRLAQLEREIEFYFKARGEAHSPRAEEARARFRQQGEEFARNVATHRERAEQQLELRRKQFLDRLDPLFHSSVQGVARTTEQWRGLYWSTLRAIVQREGVFRSPSTGKSHDFNGDLAEPLLAELPLSWEAYFTDDLGRVTDELAIRVQESGKNFCSQVSLTAELLSGLTENPMDDQLTWFQQKVSMLADEVGRSVARSVTERRSELAMKVPVVAKQRMQPAYDRAKDERGPGMKVRMLGHLETTALESAQPIYATIQAMILEGLGDLEVVITGLFQRLTETAIAQAQTVVHNTNLGLDQATTDPVVSAALTAMPRSAA